MKKVEMPLNGECIFDDGIVIKDMEVVKFAIKHTTALYKLNPILFGIAVLHSWHMVYEIKCCGRKIAEDFMFKF